jgi:predicted CoA-binding protein
MTPFTTLVLGASENTDRYSNIAIRMLRSYHFETIAIGNKVGKVLNVPITIFNPNETYHNVHTITLYLNPKNQEKYYNFILNLKPERVIFNPGTENQDFMDELERNNIEVTEACTLVLLRTQQYKPL